MAPPRRRGVLFLNPRAGSFTSSDESELRTLAYDSGLEVIDVVPGLDIPPVVKSALEKGLRSIVVAGGDGSIHHVLQSLVRTDGELGIVPIGTVNHLARDLRLPLDWREALEVAVRGKVRQIDCGSMNGTFFLNGTMIGLYPTISHYREQFRSTHSKWRAYARAARLAMSQFHHESLVVDFDGHIEALRTQLFIVAVNSYDLTQTGLIALKTRLDDGRLSVYSVGSMTRLEFMRAAAKFFRGRIAEVRSFRHVRTAQVRVDSTHHRLRVALDGELMHVKPPLLIRAEPASLLVRALD